MLAFAADTLKSAFAIAAWEAFWWAVRTVEARRARRAAEQAERCEQLDAVDHW